MTYAPAKFEVATSRSLGEDAFTRMTFFDLELVVKVLRSVFQYLQHHVTYTPATSEVAMSKG